LTVALRFLLKNLGVFGGLLLVAISDQRDAG